MHILIVANGSPSDLPSLVDLPETDRVIAADGGAANARRLGLWPSVVIGDMDSIDAALRAELERAGAEFVQHPAKKDATDLELALRYAVQAGADEITLVGAFGGRTDQALANVFLLTAAFLQWAAIHLLGSDWQAWVIRDTVEFEGQKGDLVSLIPLSPQVGGVTTTGLYWPLEAEDMSFGSTLGISNHVVANVAAVDIASGILLVVHSREKESTWQQVRKP
jgi:thiamine pyrophosphokinase